MKLIFIIFLAFCIGCVHTGMKQQGKKANKGMPSENKSSSLDDYIGSWKVEKETYGCFPIKIEKDPTEGSIKIMRKSSVYTLSKDSLFDSPPERTISDYHKYKLSTSTVLKFIRGKIVSAHIWTPDTKDWLGVGLRTWTLDKGFLVKKKAGVTMQNQFSIEPREKANLIFKLGGDDIVLKWEVECRYIKSSTK